MHAPPKNGTTECAQTAMFVTNSEESTREPTIMLAQDAAMKLIDMGASNVKIMRGTELLLKDYNPSKGELCYDVDTERYYMWSGSTWICLGTMNESTDQTSHPTNCVNCGAILHSCRCEYCGTEYFD